MNYYNLMLGSICGILLFDNYKQYNTIKNLESRIKRYEFFYMSETKRSENIKKE